MKILNDYYTFIFIIFAVILIGILVINYLKQSKITKALIDTKFSAKASIICNVKNNKRYVYLTISNKSLSDATLSSFGFQIGVKRLGFTDVYKIQKNITVNKITIPARGFIEMYVSVVEIEKVVALHITKKKPEKVSLFVVDSVGNVHLSNAKIINAIIKEDAKELKLGIEKAYERSENDFTETETYFKEDKSSVDDDLVEEIIEDDTKEEETTATTSTEEKAETPTETEVKETKVEEKVEEPTEKTSTQEETKEQVEEVNETNEVEKTITTENVDEEVDKKEKISEEITE